MLCFAMARLAPAAWRNMRLYHLQQQCLKHGAAADAIVLASPTASSSSDPFQRFYRLHSPPGSRASATVFVHQRRTPSGRARLVAVEAHLVDGRLLLYARVFTVGSPLSAPAERLGSTGRALDGAALRAETPVLAGQIDPDDPTHFTIRHGKDGRIIDGWLHDDDTVLLEPRQLAPSLPMSAGSSP